AKLYRDALDKVLVRVNSGPMRATIVIIVEFPKMQELIDCCGIGLDVSTQLLVVIALLERGEANLLIKLHRLGHCANAERIHSQFIERHRTFTFRKRFEPQITSAT